MFINFSLVVLSNFAAPVLSNCFFRAADFVFCGNVCLCLFFFSRGCFIYFEKVRIYFCICSPPSRFCGVILRRAPRIFFEYFLCF